MRRLFLFLLFFLMYAAELQATTYWSSPSGGAGTCAAASGTSDPGQYRTLLQGIACLSGGDTLILKNGVYTQRIDTLTNPIPSGTTLIEGAGATTIRAENRRQPIMRPTSVGGIINIANGESNIILRGLVIDGVNNTTGMDTLVSLAGNSSYIRLDDLEVKTTRCNLIEIASSSGGGGGSNNAEVINSTLHGVAIATCGVGVSSDSGYGIYASAQNVLISNNEMYDLAAYGIHGYSDYGGVNNNTYRLNKIYDFGKDPAQNYWAGILASSGSGNAVYGNIIHDSNNSRSACIAVSNGASNAVIYNNTCYNVSTPYAGITYGNDTGSVIRNNIVYGLAGGTPHFADSDPAGNTPTFSNNLCQSAGTGCAIIGNPLFVNASAGNFGLQAGSPAINSGVASIVAGVNRVYNGSAPDIGAHETVVLSSCSVGGNTLTLNFENNLHPPMIFPSVTGSSLLVDGSSRTLSALSVATNTVTMTFSGAAFQALATYNYTPGAVTDSALIGGTNNQRLNAIINQNCGGTPPPPPPTLVAWYQFEELVGTAPQDSSGNGLHGSFGSGVSYTASGKYGRGLSFAAGAATEMTVPDNDLLDLDTFSIMAWIRPAAPSATYQSIINKTHRYFIYSTTGPEYCGAGFPIGGSSTTGSGHDIVCHASALPANIWTHLAFTRSNDTLILYRDGVSVATAPVTLAAGFSSAALLIGGSQYGERFEGILDDVKLYTGVRSQAQIVEDMAGPSTLVTLKLGSQTVKLGDKTIKIGN